MQEISCEHHILDQGLEQEASDTRRHVENLSRLSQSMLSLVADTATKDGIKTKLHSADVALQKIEVELG